LAVFFIGIPLVRHGAHNDRTICFQDGRKYIMKPHIKNYFFRQRPAYSGRVNVLSRWPLIMQGRSDFIRSQEMLIT